MSPSRALGGLPRQIISRLVLYWLVYAYDCYYHVFAKESYVRRVIGLIYRLTRLSTNDIFEYLTTPNLNLITNLAVSHIS